MRSVSCWIWSFAFLVAACSGKSDHGRELEQLMQSSSATEVLARTQSYLDAGEESAPIYFARGWAELKQDADLPAKDAFAECMLLDGSYGPRIAVLWQQAALADAADSTRWYNRAGRRMVQAYLHDRTIALEPLGDNVANIIFKEEKMFDAALSLYRELRKDTKMNFNKRKEWEFRYGRCFQLTGQIDSAMTIYDGYLKRFPKDGGFDNYSAFFWMVGHREQAEEALAKNDLDAALRWIVAAPRENYHMAYQQELRLLRGKIHEARSEHRDALTAYEAILENGDSSGAEVVQSAKDRIDAIHAMGIR